MMSFQVITAMSFPQTGKNSNGFDSIYVIGIIDFLQKWDKGKVAESLAKSRLLGLDKTGISALEPRQYGDRFLSFLGKCLSILQSFLLSTTQRQGNSTIDPHVRLLTLGNGGVGSRIVEYVEFDSD